MIFDFNNKKTKTMKTLKVTFLIVIMLIMSISYSQNSPNVSIANMNCNILYRGLDNPINIAVSEHSMSDIYVNVSDGANLEKQGTSYTIRLAEKSPDKIQIEVGINTKDGQKKIDTQSFRVLNPPPPTILLGGAFRDGHKVPSLAVLYNAYLEARLESSFFPYKDIEYKVVSYNFLYQENGTNKIIEVDGERLSKEVIEIVENLDSGSTIAFTNIMVNTPAGIKQTKGISIEIH